MKNSKIRALIVLSVAVAVSVLLVLAGDSKQTSPTGLSSLAICAILSFVIQWLVFVPSYLKQSEKVYDLTGSLTFITVTFVALNAHSQVSLTSIMLASMVCVWAARLGTFLFVRINKDGIDGRFDDIKPDMFRFFSAWTLQGLWVFVTASAALMVITSPQQASVHHLTWVGLGIWLFGFVFEVLADTQKYRFKQKPQNKGKFIRTGLWSISRHPNYFGEIALWFGVAIAAIPALSGWQYVSMISPVFVTLLLTKISGVPLLEKRADERWQDDPDYQKYKSSTPVLVPFIGRK